MKILWFTNTPCSAAEKLEAENHRGGWLKSLEQALSANPDIRLHICFYSRAPHAPFEYKNTKYFPVYRKSAASKTKRFIQRFRPVNNDAAELTALRQIVEEVKPDLLHFHGTEDNFGMLQQSLAVPAVVSIQGILTPYAEKFYAGIPAAVARKHEGIRAKINYNTSGYQFSTIQRKAERERTVLRHSKHIIGRTDWDRQVTKLLAPGSHYFINNEVLRQSFYTNTWQKKAFDKKLKIVTISSDSIYKGFETILKTAGLLKTYPGFDFEWQVIGLHKNSQVVKTALSWLKQDLAALNITLLGGKEELEVAELLLSADIYCQVSHIENSPNSLCEAMLLGMPVVASSAGGTPSLLTGNEEGLLVQDGDPFAFAGALLQLNASFDTASGYGKKARTRALERHNKQTIVSDLINIYTEVLKKKRP
ncbi:MAG: glycosyltransferase family 4 protein [Chitinophagaceae bacterium]